MPDVLGDIRSQWSNAPITVKPIDQTVISDFQSQWGTGLKSKDDDNYSRYSRTAGRFCWETTFNKYASVGNRFDVAIYENDKLLSLAIGGWQNWNDRTNGHNVYTNVTAIDIIQVAPDLGMIKPSIALLSTIETARLFSEEAGRSTIAINNPSDIVKGILQGVGIEPIDDHFIFPIEDLDYIYAFAHSLFNNKPRPQPIEQTNRPTLEEMIAVSGP